MKEQLHKKALQIAKEYRKAEWQMIEVLQEIDQKKLYYHYNCNSLFQYCLEYLKLSEGAAYGLIRIARKSEQVPELKEKIKSGEIATSKAVKICSLLKSQTPEQKSIYAKPKDLSLNECLANKSYNQEWLKKAENLSSKELEIEIIKEKPRDYSLKENKRLLSQDYHSLNLKLTKEEMQLLEKLKDITRAESIGEAIQKVARDYLKRKDPVQKKSIAIPKNSGANKNSRAVLKNSSASKKSKRSKITDAIKVNVYKKHKGHCKECGSSKYLEIHHKIPISSSGTNEEKNLELLCSACHKMKHYKPLNKEASLLVNDLIF